MENDADCMKVIQDLNGFVYNGRTVRIDLAKRQYNGSQNLDASGDKGFIYNSIFVRFQ